jgi:hypothetical protein
MAGEATNVRGPCSSCGAPLATDQRYCVECGQRVGPPLALPYALPAPGTERPAARTGWLAALPIPVQTATTFAAIALGFGVVIGTAISPNLAGIIAAPPPPVVAEAPPETPPPAATGGGGGPAAPAPAAAAAAPTVVSTTPTGSTGGGGGGGGHHKKKKKKQQKAAPITFSGTVVRTNPVAQSYTVSTGSGLIAIHADTLPQAGAQVESQVRKLNNGTYAESGSRTPTGTADVASLQGTVTYCADLEQPTEPCDGSNSTDHYVYAVSALGSSVLVSWPHSAANPPPKVGSQVQVAVHIGSPFAPIDPTSSSDWTQYPAPCSPAGSEQNGVPGPPSQAADLTQTSLNVTAQRTNATIEAVVQETNCPGGLVLSADDVRETGRDMTALSVPAGIDQARLTRGQAVQVAVDIDGAGALTLRGITSDQGTAGADDPSQGQGTLTGS